MGSRCTQKSWDFQAGLKWTEEMLPALFWTVFGRSLAGCCVSVGSCVKTQQVKEGKIVPILMIGWAGGKLSHGPGTVFHNLITLICSFPGYLVCVWGGRCKWADAFAHCLISKSAIRPQGTTCSLWLGAISHLNNDICHHFCTSSCPSSYLQTRLNMSAWVSSNRPAQF